MAENFLMDVKESSLVDAVLSVDTVKDEEGQEFLLLTLHFETNTAVRLPMGTPVAMRLWALLDQARKDNGWPAPVLPVSVDKMQ
jgi:hypothetical protein